MDRVDVNGRRIAFRAAGTGPPVLLLHGAQADSRDWQYQFDAFAPYFTTVAWDAPGRGQPPAPAGPLPRSPGLPHRPGPPRVPPPGPPWAALLPLRSPLVIPRR